MCAYPCSNHCSVEGDAVSNAVVLAVIESVQESNREVANMATTKLFKCSFSACYPIENESQTILGGKGQFHRKGQSHGKCIIATGCQNLYSIICCNVESRACNFFLGFVISSTGRDQSSLCDTPLSVCPSVRPSVCPSGRLSVCKQLLLPHLL